MENGCSCERKTITNELLQGMDLAKQLRVHLGINASSVKTRDLLVQRILASYENALRILKSSGSMASTPGIPESPLSINGSPQSEDFDKDNQDSKESSKKRKTQPRWTDQVKVSSEGVLEGPHDDGFSWRKYGQKDILGAKYPRSYYRCTFRNSKNCWATKQVQRSDEDPTIFDVTYRGTHNCIQGSQAIPPPASPEKQEQKLNNHNNTNSQQEMLLNFKKSLRVDTKGLDNKEMAPPFSFPSTSFGCSKNGNLSFSPTALDNLGSFSPSFSPSFMSPATPELNYFSSSRCQRNNFDVQCCESYLTELISANTSATNSPIMEHWDFPLDPVEFDPNFPLDTPGFFS